MRPPRVTVQRKKDGEEDEFFYTGATIGKKTWRQLQTKLYPHKIHVETTPSNIVVFGDEAFGK